MGHSWREMIPTDQHAIVDQVTEQRILGAGSRYELDLARPDGERRTVIVSGSPLFDNGIFNGTMAVFTDITDEKRAEQERELLNRVRTVVENELDLPTLLTHVVETIVATFGYSHASLYVLFGETLVLQHQVGYENVIRELPVTEGLAGRVARRGQPILLEDVRTDSAYLTVTAGIASRICIPLFVEAKVIGVLNVESAEPVRLTESDLDMMAALGQGISPAIGRARLYTQLQESEAQLNEAQHHAHIGSWRYLPNGTRFWSDEMYELFKLPREVPPTLETMLSVIHLEDRDAKYNGAFENALNSDALDFHTEYRVVWPDGQVRTLASIGKIRRQADGQVIEAVGTVQDITERQQAEARMAYQAYLLANINDAVIATDEKQVITAWNHAAAALYGWDAHEAIGNPVQEIIPWEITEAQRAMAHQKLTAGERFTVETLQYHRTGRPIWVEGNTIALRDDSGNINGFVTVNRDITERKRAEDQLRYQALLLKNVSDAIVATDTDGIVKSWNGPAEAMFGYTAEEAIGQPAPTLVKIEYLDTTPAEAYATLQQAGLSTAEVRITAREGTVIYSIASASTIRDSAGNHLGYLTINHDITARKRAEERVQQARLRAEHSESVLLGLNAAAQAVQQALTLAEVYRIIGEEIVNFGHQAAVYHLSDDLSSMTIAHITYAPGLMRQIEKLTGLSPMGYQIPIKAGSLIGRAIEEKRTVPSTERDIEEFITDNLPARVRRLVVRVIAMMGLKTGLNVPLVTNDKVVGILFVSGDLGEGDIPAMTAFANQAAIALEKARLYGQMQQEIAERKKAEEAIQQARERAERSERTLLALNQASQSVQQALTREAVYRAIGDEIVKLGCQALIYHLSEDLATMQIEYLSHAPGLIRQVEKVTGFSLKEYPITLKPGNITKQAIFERQAFLSEDRDVEAFIAEAVPARHRAVIRRGTAMLGLMKGINAPMIINDQVIGILLISGPDLDAADIPAISAFANHAAIAIEKARLHEQAQMEIAERKQAEEKLRESEEKIRAVFDVLSVGISVLNAARQIVQINPALEKILGISAEGLLGGAYRSRQYIRREGTPMPPSEFPTVHAVETQRPVNDVEIGVVKENGETIWTSVSAAPLRGMGVVAVTMDITERKQAEQLLIASETRFRALIDQSADLIAVIDTAGVVQFASPSAERILGYSPEEAIGRNFMDWLHPDDMALASESLASRRNVPGPAPKSIEVRSLHKNGMWRTMDVLGTNLLAERAVGGIVLNVRDITERKQAENEIQHHVAELELLYQNGLALNQLSSPQAIGQKIIELLDQKLDWHHTAVRLLNAENDSLELLAFNKLGLQSAADKSADAKRFSELVTKVGEGLSGWAIKLSETIRSGEVGDDPRYVDTFPGLHSGLYVPMKLGGRIIGVISIESERRDAFSEADERLVNTLANQAAIALENTHLLEAEREQRSVAEAISETAAQVNSSLNLDAILDRLMENISRVVPYDASNIMLIEGGQAGSTRERGYSERGLADWLAQVNLPVSQFPNLRAMADSGLPLAIADTAQYPGWIHIPETSWIRSHVSAPICVAGQAIGFLSLDSETPGFYNSAHAGRLQTFANQAGSAIQNARLFAENTTLFAETKQRLEQVQALRSIDQAISGSLDLRLILNVVAEQTLTQLKADAVDILLLDPQALVLNFAAGRGFRTPALQHTHLRVGEGFAAGRAALERRVITITDYASLVNGYPRPAITNLQREGFASYTAAPLIAKGQVRGVLEIFHRSHFEPNLDWLDFLDALAGQAAIAIDNITLFDGMQRSNVELGLAYDATIEGWSYALDLRDKETEGHTQRVTDLSMRLARRLGLSEAELIHVRRGALLHDIGKMGVPDSILHKPGPLNDEEWVIMRKHPQLAFEMLSPITYLRPALDIPYCHHERWDGGEPPGKPGYPRGLRGEQIPLAARIFAVVDVWDALTSDRPYRPAWEAEKALAHIQAESGRHFDPRVVSAFLELIGEG